MKKIISVILSVLMLNLSVFATPNLKNGTSVRAEFRDNITSKKGEANGIVVAQDILDENGNILIEKGSPIRVSLIKEKAKGAGKEGEIIINAVSTVAKDGKTINLYGNHTVTGNNKLGLALGLGIGLGCTLLPFVGFAFIAIKGGEAKIQQGHIIDFATVDANYTIAVQ